MRNVMVIGSVIVLVLSFMITGTILAQDDGTNTDTATAWLGISFAETDAGVAVKRVMTGSPAAEGGLLVGDVIVSVDDQTIESADVLTEIVQAHEPGDVISITVLRNDSERTLEIELGSSPVRRHDGIPAEMDPLVMAEMVLHVELSAVDDGYQVLAGRTRSEDTLAVGDVITAANGTPITEVDWQTLLTELVGQDNPVLTLTVQRDGEEITVDIEQFGGFRGHGPMDEHGGPNRDNAGRPDRFGAPDDSGSQNGNAPDTTAPDAMTT
jgi:S1-C subfamily serine protease